MKIKALVLLLIVALKLNISAQSDVSLVYTKNLDLTTQDKITIGFEYDTRRGKIKKKGKYYSKSGKINKFNLKVNGGTYHIKSGEIILDRSAVNKNDGYVFLEYKHPYNKSIIKKDTIVIPQITKINFVSTYAYYGETITSDLMVEYSNRKIRKIQYHKANTFLNDNHLELKCINAKTADLENIKVKGKTQLEENEFVKFKFKTSKGKSDITTDSIPILGVKDINFHSDKFYFDRNNFIMLDVVLKNDSVRAVNGYDARDLLEANNIKIEAQNGKIVAESIVIQEVSDSFNLKVSFISSHFIKTFNFDIILEADYLFRFEGTSGNENGAHGYSVDIQIEEYNIEHNIYKVHIQSNTRSETIYFNPTGGEIRVYNEGQNGEEGREGEEGDDHDEDEAAEAGSNGYDGGDGGDGGHIRITMPKSFRANQNAITVHNRGGNGGEGGDGGKGGRLDTEGNKGLLGYLFPSRADSGNQGRSGRNGRNGVVDYFYKD